MKKSVYTILLLSFLMVMPLTVTNTLSEDLEREVGTFTPSQDYETVTWHHDCSNTTGFLSDPNPQPWPYPYGVSVNDGVDLLSDGSSIYSSSIPYEGEGESDRHGATYFLKLPSALKLYGLDLEVSFTHAGTSTRMGSAMVNLCDAANLSTYYVAGYDGWYSSQIRESNGFLNSSEHLYYDSADSTPSGDWTGSIRIYHDIATGQVLNTDSSGTEILLSGSEFEPGRTVQYVALTFFIKGSYIYETWKINDILIKGTPTSSLAIWHHDGSNSTGWVEQSEAPDSYPPIIQTGIPLASDGDSLYVASIPPLVEDLNHGPLYTMSFDEPIPIGANLSLITNMTHIGTDNRMAGTSVNLYDENMTRVFYAWIADGWYSDMFRVGAFFLPSAGIYNSDYPTIDLYGPWIGEFSIWYDFDTDTMRSSVAGIERELAAPGTFDKELEVYYIGVQFWIRGSYTYESALIDDILVCWTPASTEPITTPTTPPPTTSTSTSPTTTSPTSDPMTPTSPEGIDPLVFTIVVLGMGGTITVLVVIVVILFRKGGVGTPGESGSVPYKW